MNLYSVYYLFIALIIFAIFPEIIQQSVTIDLTHSFSRANLYPIYIYIYIKIDRAWIYRKECNNRSRKHHARTSLHLSPQGRRDSRWHGNFLPTCITLDLLRIVFPDGWYRSMSLRIPRTPTSSASTRRKAVILTKLYLKSSRSKVSISWNTEMDRVFETRGSAFHPLPRPECTYESCEEIVVLVVVHLQLQYLKADIWRDYFHWKRRVFLLIGSSFFPHDAKFNFSKRYPNEE